jgi:hypothetical protein
LWWLALSWLFPPFFCYQDKRGDDRSPFSGNSGDSWNIRPANYYKDREAAGGGKHDEAGSDEREGGKQDRPCWDKGIGKLDRRHR